jgi:hypothetical protein
MHSIDYQGWTALRQFWLGLELRHALHRQKKARLEGLILWMQARVMTGPVRRGRRTARL